MSETEALPAHPNLDWYKKAAKKRLEELRTRDPDARLADAQLSIARENGFSSWRKLKDRIDQLTDLPKLVRRNPPRRPRENALSAQRQAGIGAAGWI